MTRTDLIELGQRIMNMKENEEEINKLEDTFKRYLIQMGPICFIIQKILILERTI